MGLLRLRGHVGLITVLLAKARLVSRLVGLLIFLMKIWVGLLLLIGVLRLAAAVVSTLALLTVLALLVAAIALMTLVALVDLIA